MELHGAGVHFLLTPPLGSAVLEPNLVGFKEDIAVITTAEHKHEHMQFCPVCHEELSYLNADFWQVDLHSQLLPTVDIWVVGLLEGSLQLMELIGGEGGAISPVLLFGVVLIFSRFRGALVVVQVLLKVTHPPVTLVTGEKA